MTDTYLTVKWTVSRGRETYGYNICTLTDTDTGKKYRCNGGGYDLLGTVFGEWLQDVHQRELMTIASDAYTKVTASHTEPWTRETNKAGHYGMTYNEPSSPMPLAYVVLDGACGLDSMKSIAKAIGLSVRTNLANKRGTVEGFIVSDSR